MIAKGHMLLATTGALATYIYLPYEKNFGTYVVSYIFILLGSVLPDIDESESWIGKKLGAVSILTDLAIKHRTITHYFFIPLIIFILGLFYITDPTKQIVVLSLAFGIFLHDVGDMLTKGGIKGFFFPFFPNTKIALLPRFLRFYTNSIQEWLLIAVLICINSILAMYFLSNLILYYEG